MAECRINTKGNAFAFNDEVQGAITVRCDCPSTVTGTAFISVVGFWTDFHDLVHED